MRLVSYKSAEGVRVGGVRHGTCVDLARTDPSLPTAISALLARWPDCRPAVERAIDAGQPVPLAEIRLLPVVPAPRKIICVGLNYADHAAETAAKPPSEPVIFNKFPTAIAGHWQPIELPPSSSEVDYEAELVVVIGRGGRDIPAAHAMEHVAGYCCGNDISARDWQMRKPGGQWLLGKSFDTFAPIGPSLVTADELPEPGRLAIELRLNGRVMQRSNTEQLIFPVEALVAYVSAVCTLQPGDLIFTGTPGGVGFARKPPVFLKPGDVLEVEIEGIGVLSNPVVARRDASGGA